MNALRHDDSARAHGMAASKGEQPLPDPLAAIAPALYTDPAAMRALLQTQLPGFADGRLRIDGLRVHSVRRTTSRERKPCVMTLCYTLHITDGAQQRRGAQTLFAQVFRPGLSAPAWAAQDRGRLAPPAFGEPLVHLGTLNMLLWALPNDPGLPQLLQLLDTGRAATLLQQTCGIAAATDVHVDLLRHAPQHRATLRYTLNAGAPGAARSIFAKTFCDERAADVHARFLHFWHLARHNADAPLVAEPLGVDTGTRTAWQAGAPGVPLRQMLIAGQGERLMGQVARALAVLHAAPLSLAAREAPHSVAHWLTETRRRQNKIGRVDPRLGARAADIAAAIHAHAPHPASRAAGLIHGDCHPDQFWMHEGRVVLFDFDEFALGDPMEDVAAFVLRLEQIDAPPALASSLLQQYAAAAPERFDARSLAWHLTIQSLLQVSRSFIYQEPGWAAQLERRLAAAAARAASLGRSNL